MIANNRSPLSVLQVAMLAEVDSRTIEMAYQYGRNIGLAFQLVDDLLDFVATSESIGKPVATDLKLGLATAPVLFACEQVSVQETYGESRYNRMKCDFCRWDRKRLFPNGNKTFVLI